MPLKIQFKSKIPARRKKGCISWKRIRFHGGSVLNRGEERSFVDLYLKGGEQVAPVGWPEVTPHFERGSLEMADFCLRSEFARI